MKNKALVFFSIFALGFAILCPSICALNQKISDTTHNCCASQKQTPHHQNCSESCNLHRETVEMNQISLPQVDFSSIIISSSPKLGILSGPIWGYDKPSLVYPSRQLAWLKTIRIQC